MLLTKLSYEENKGLPSNWRIENVNLSGVSLVVGKNSSGKTRLLNVIDNLAKMISGRVPVNFGSGTWECHFERRKNQAVEYQEYKVELKNRIVAEESFEINRQKIMQRRDSGSGFVLKKSNKSRVNYKVPQNQLMAVVRRDEIQHPYFDHLYKWGAELCYYRFGSDLGKNSFTAVGPNEPPVDHGLPLANFVDNAAHVFRKTTERFDSYKGMILEDLESLGYPSKDVLLGLVNNFFFNGIPPMQLGVMEEGRTWPTYQSEMSQGMYRALAISIQLNANILWAQSTKVGRELTFGDAPTVIIDDIGEGLDFTRPKALVKRLMEKAKEYSIQLVMSSNDRFIMNDVPLENWVILHREGSVVKTFDHINSKELFEEFKYLGLNNFDFFSGDLFLRGQK
jgi:ABC-type Na+ transport system ATPase subunit NatA